MIDISKMTDEAARHWVLFQIIIDNSVYGYARTYAEEAGRDEINSDDVRQAISDLIRNIGTVVLTENAVNN